MLNSKDMLSYELEKRDEWAKWREEIPFIPFKETWQIKIIPPSSNAIVRFQIRSTINYESWCSIYLDCYDKLGSYGKPYWEVYPVEGDVARCDMEDITSLLLNIAKALNENP